MWQNIPHLNYIPAILVNSCTYLTPIEIYAMLQTVPVKPDSHHLLENLKQWWQFNLPEISFKGDKPLSWPAIDVKSANQHWSVLHATIGTKAISTNLSDTRKDQFNFKHKPFKDCVQIFFIRIEDIFSWGDDKENVG